ncbi:MAG: 2,3-bisphosphoglycerate-independent phosphoglycerate mutase [Gammaproteobacteria bacterium]|jgi:2,3-bisphosphoglycerate-independent phosphoglycerate mutase
MSVTSCPKPIVLTILDGWGYREDSQDNAILHANTPFWDQLCEQHPRTLIDTSGMAVGLPEGQMGNSEVGHMSLGSGRVVYQNFTRVTKAIADGEFQKNPAFCKAIDDAVAADGAVHIMGLLSPGGVHSHEDHIHAAIELAAARGATKIYLHGFLDGRDVAPRCAAESLAKADTVFAKLGVGRVASLVGRYYAMDRDNRWERVSPAYNLITQAEGDYQYASASEALAASYARDEGDEFVKTSVIQAEGQEPARVNDGDSMIFMNFRADRAREITRPFIEADFAEFDRQSKAKLSAFVCLTEYHAEFDAPSAYAPEALSNVLGEYLEKQGKTQLRIAETEKYAHVTFFFSGGRENEFDGETRILVPSPNVATYDLQPEMSAPEVTDKLIGAIESGKYDLIVVNYANPDMVGHTGVFSAAVKAVEAIDKCLSRLVPSVEAAGGEMLITADHGNIELMRDNSANQPHTAHTTNLVPLVYVGRAASIKDGGTLCDIAPTMLTLMGLDLPKEMTGSSLVTVA